MDGADLLREALVHPDNTSPSDLRAELLGQLASVMGMPSITGQPDDATGARRVITELREMIRHHPTERARAALALAELNVMSGPTHFAERQAWFANGIGANPSGRLQDRLERGYWDTSLAFERGEFDAVETAIESWAVLADRSPSMYWRWRVTMAKASLLYVRGRFDEAVLVARQSLSLVVNLYPAMAYRVYAGLLFAVRREQGRLGSRRARTRCARSADRARGRRRRAGTKRAATGGPRHESGADRRAVLAVPCLARRHVRRRGR
jgi:hypothetical protein